MALLLLISSVSLAVSVLTLLYVMDIEARQLQDREADPVAAVNRLRDLSINQMMAAERAARTSTDTVPGTAREVTRP